MGKFSYKHILIALIVVAPILVYFSPESQSSKSNKAAAAFRKKCEASNTTGKEYIYKEGKLVKAYISTLPADCFGADCKYSDPPASLAMRFINAQEETNTALGGTQKELEKYQASLMQETEYGFCVEPYIVNKRTRWRLQQELKIIPLQGE